MSEKKKLDLKIGSVYVVEDVINEFNDSSSFSFNMPDSPEGTNSYHKSIFHSPLRNVLMGRKSNSSFTKQSLYIFQRDGSLCTLLNTLIDFLPHCDVLHFSIDEEAKKICYINKKVQELVIINDISKPTVVEKHFIPGELLSNLEKFYTKNYSFGSSCILIMFGVASERIYLCTHLFLYCFDCHAKEFLVDGYEGGIHEMEIYDLYIDHVTLEFDPRCDFICFRVVERKAGVMHDIIDLQSSENDDNIFTLKKKIHVSSGLGEVRFSEYWEYLAVREGIDSNLEIFEFPSLEKIISKNEEDFRFEKEDSNVGMFDTEMTKMVQRKLGRFGNFLFDGDHILVGRMGFDWEETQLMVYLDKDQEICYHKLINLKELKDKIASNEYSTSTKKSGLRLAGSSRFSLPQEILFVIISFLDIKQIMGKIELLNKSFLNNSMVWSICYNSRWKLKIKEEEEDQERNYKKMYINRALVESPLEFISLRGSTEVKFI